MALKHVRGLDDLLAAMQALPEKVAANYMKKALLSGAAVIKKEAVRLAPVYKPGVTGAPDYRVDPGLLKRAIFMKYVPELSGKYSVVVIVGVRSGRKERHRKRGKSYVNFDAYYAPWVEYGHWFVPPKPTVTPYRAHRAKYRNTPGALWVPAKPFMRPAFDTRKDAAADAVADKLREQIANRGASNDDSGKLSDVA